MRGLKHSAVAALAQAEYYSVARSAPLMRGLKPGLHCHVSFPQFYVARSAPLMRGLKPPAQFELFAVEAINCRAVCPANEGIET